MSARVWSDTLAQVHTAVDLLRELRAALAGGREEPPAGRGSLGPDLGLILYELDCVQTEIARGREAARWEEVQRLGPAIVALRQVWATLAEEIIEIDEEGRVVRQRPPEPPQPIRDPDGTYE